MLYRPPRCACLSGDIPNVSRMSSGKSIKIGLPLPPWACKSFPRWPGRGGDTNGKIPSYGWGAICSAKAGWIIPPCRSSSSLSVYEYANPDAEDEADDDADDADDEAEDDAEDEAEDDADDEAEDDADDEAEDDAEDKAANTLGAFIKFAKVTKLLFKAVVACSK